MRSHRRPTDVHSLPKLDTFRTKSRKNLTSAEARFWTIVKNAKMDGRKFRRPHSVGRYILDFYCPSERWVSSLTAVHFHDAAREYDYERKLFLEHFGIKVIRFENKLVFDDEDFVVRNIQNCFGWWEKS